MRKKKIFLNKLPWGIRSIVDIVVIIAAVATIISLGISIGELKKDKHEIYDFFKTQLKEQKETIRKFRNENFLLKNQLNQIKTDKDNKDRNFRVLSGRLISVDKIPIADVKIWIEGGSQSYSFSNGEFLIRGRVGELIQFKKNGYKLHKLTLNHNHFDQYNKITLKGN